MSEYVPRVVDVRECYASSGDGLEFRFRFFERYAEFDRWITRVRAEALQTAALEWQELDPHLVGYDMHAWIIERAEGMREAT